MRVAVERIDGVKAVEVSLNEGFAEVSLASPNTVTIRQLREVIRRNGFTPREARIRARGTVIPLDTSLVLEVLVTQESFLLEVSDAMAPMLREAGVVTIVGMVPDSRGSDTTTLQVIEVRK